MLPKLQKNTLHFARLSRVYAARRGANPALAACPTLDALVSALHGAGGADPGARCRLICAVIAEHQAEPDPLWAAIVLHAFRGMLVLLSKSLLGVDDRDEADALVAAALLEALRRVRPERDPDRIGMYVRQETRRVVFAALRRDARARQYWPADEEETSCAGEDPSQEQQPQDAPPEGEGPGDCSDEDTCDEATRDPLAREAASRHVQPDMLEDPESSTPLEDRLVFYAPTVDGVPDEYLLRVHSVRGGLRRLTEHLFAHASASDRRSIHRQLLLRTQRLLANRK